MSLTEYAEAMNAMEARASERAEALVAAAEQETDLTPQDVQAGLEEAGEIRAEIDEAAAAMDPLDQIADLHDLVFGWHARLIAAEAALAVRAADDDDTEEGWTSLSDSPEMAAYRSTMAEGKELCGVYQAELDATAEQGIFEDTPWIPSEMGEVVQAVVGCQWFPDNPEDVYRYPPPESVS